MRGLNRTIGWGVVFATALVLSGCSSSGTTSVATSPNTSAAETVTSSASPSPSATSVPIPNGTYKTTATRREALAKGFTNKEIDHWYGPDGKQPLTIVLDNGAFEMNVEDDDGVVEVGAKGTYTATKNQWIATSESPGCPGCVYTYRWSFDGKVLSLKLTNGSAGPKDSHLARLVTEHDYVKVG